jgi:hypothetical protein
MLRSHQRPLDVSAEDRLSLSSPIYIYMCVCDMLRPNAVVAGQREVKRVSVHTLDPPKILDYC